MNQEGRRPVPIKGSEKEIIVVDKIITAIGQCVSDEFVFAGRQN